MKGTLSRRDKPMVDYKFTVFFEPLPEGGYQVVFPSIPEIVTFGKSLEGARLAAREALRCHLEGLLKDGEQIPVERQPFGEPIKETVGVSI